MIIVTGHLRTESGDRDRLVTLSQDAVRAARATDGCLDFAVGPDPLDPERVNVTERWRTRAQLDTFRAAGPDDGTSALITSYAIDEYEITDAP